MSVVSGFSLAVPYGTPFSGTSSGTPFGGNLFGGNPFGGNPSDGNLASFAATTSNFELVTGTVRWRYQQLAGPIWTSYPYFGCCLTSC